MQILPPTHSGRLYPPTQPHARTHARTPFLPWPPPHTFHIHARARALTHHIVEMFHEEVVPDVQGDELSWGGVWRGRLNLEVSIPRGVLLLAHQRRRGRQAAARHQAAGTRWQQVSILSLVCSALKPGWPSRNVSPMDVSYTIIIMSQS